MRWEWALSNWIVGLLIQNVCHRLNLVRNVIKQSGAITGPLSTPDWLISSLVVFVFRPPWYLSCSAEFSCWRVPLLPMLTPPSHQLTMMMTAEMPRWVRKVWQSHRVCQRHKQILRMMTSEFEYYQPCRWRRMTPKKTTIRIFLRSVVTY